MPKCGDSSSSSPSLLYSSDTSSGRFNGSSGSKSSSSLRSDDEDDDDEDDEDDLLALVEVDPTELDRATDLSDLSGWPVRQLLRMVTAGAREGKGGGRQWRKGGDA